MASPLTQKLPGPQPDWLRRWRPWLGTAQIAFLVLLFAGSFMVRMWPLRQVRFWDETVYLQHAKVFCCGKSNYSEIASRPPMLSMLIAVAFKIKESDFFAGAVVAGINALAPLFLYWAGTMLYGPLAGALAALLMAFSPFFADTGNSIMADSPAMTFILLAFCWLVRGLRRESVVDFALAGFTCTLAILVRFTSLLMLFIFPLALLCSRNWRRAAIAFGGAFLAGLAPYLLWSKIRFGGFLTTFRLGYAYGATGLMPSGVFEPPTFYIRHWLEMFPLISVLGVALWPVAVLLERRLRVEKGSSELTIHFGTKQQATPLLPESFLWWWFIFALVYFTNIPNRQTRFLMPLAGAWCLLAGRGLTALLQPRTLYGLALGAAILFVGYGHAFAPTLQRFQGPFVDAFVSEEKQAADLLNQQARPTSVLYTNFNTPVWAYYTRMPHQLLQEQDASFYDVFPRNMPRDGYLVAYKELGKDPKISWLDSHPQFRRVQELRTLIVYEYRRASSE